MLGAHRAATLIRSRTRMGARATIPDRAASRPRSLSTAGCRPRTSSRSPARASTASFVCLLDGLPGGLWYVSEGGSGHAQVHRQGDQLLLRSVVQVAFDAAALGVGRGDDLGPAAGQRVDPLGQLLAPAG